MFLRSLKKMSNVLIKKIEPIEIEANKCLKVRAVTSSCTACQDICPQDCIEINESSVELRDACIHCGLCTTVCSTNALKWNHPPLMQLAKQLLRLSAHESVVYIACSHSMNGTVRANVVEVPCLGMLPSEFWLHVQLSIPNLQVLYEQQRCSHCQLSMGETLFLREKKKVEELLQQNISICDSISANYDDDGVDHQRRKFFSSLFEEVKETNTITMNEVLEVERPLSPFEKFEKYYREQNELAEIEEKVEEIKNNVIQEVLHTPVHYTDKRALLFQAIEKAPDLQKQLIVEMPEMKDSCTRCGACAFLCPTDAIVMDNQSFILSPNKCVSCRLCEDICYEQHIKLVPKTSDVFQEKYKYLLH